MEKPKIEKGKVFQFDKVVEACEEYIDFIDGPVFHEDLLGDYQNAIFELAMEATFDKDVWNFINSKF